MNSCSVAAGTLLFMTRNSGTVPIGPTGTSSVSGIVRHVPHQVGIDDDVAGVGDAERVAVGRRLGDRVHGDVAARARTIVDHHRLAGLAP